MENRVDFSLEKREEWIKQPGDRLYGFLTLVGRKTIVILTRREGGVRRNNRWESFAGAASSGQKLSELSERVRLSLRSQGKFPYGYKSVLILGACTGNHIKGLGGFLMVS
jgi:hypothetical protein